MERWLQQYTRLCHGQQSMRCDKPEEQCATATIACIADVRSGFQETSTWTWTWSENERKMIPTHLPVSAPPHPPNFAFNARIWVGVGRPTRTLLSLCCHLVATTGMAVARPGALAQRKTTRSLKPCSAFGDCGRHLLTHSILIAPPFLDHPAAAAPEPAVLANR